MKNKCPSCSLVNATTDENCRRCGALLTGDAGPREEVAEVGVPEPADEPTPRRSLGRRLLWILGATVVFLFGSCVSLRVTSDDLGAEQRQIVRRSITILEQRGFSREASVLANFTTYRSTDNWWNRFLGHRDAYAATNFPFEVLTLYPEFFADTADDEERAVILLHEAQHLFGAGEAGALEYVWRNKPQLGWTEDRYGNSRVWNNTKDLTINLVPKLFQCGPDRKSDCMP